MAVEPRTMERWRVPFPEKTSRSRGYGELGGERMTGASLLTVSPSDERFLMVHTETETNCSTMVTLFIVGKDGAELVAVGSSDCDV